MSPLPLASPPARARSSWRGSLLRERGVALAAIAALSVVAVPRRGTPPDVRVDAVAVEAERALTEFRGAIEHFRRDHGQWPGSAAEDAALARDLLGGERPYLASFPANPVSGRSDVRILDRWFGTDRRDVTTGGSGWVYDAARGRVWLDTLGAVRASASNRRAGDTTRWMDL